MRAILDIGRRDRASTRHDRSGMTGERKRRGRIAGLVVALPLLALGGLLGAAAPSQAATAFTVDLQPLIGSAGNEIPQVSFGGKIGYRLFVQNTGESTTRHASIVVTSTTATFLDADNAACAANPSNARQMVCMPAGATLAPGDTFAVNFRFTAPTSGAQVSTTAALTIAAQTVGGKGNNGTTLTSSSPVLTNLVENATKQDTYLRGNEGAATGNLGVSHAQRFGLQLPGSLLGNPFGVAVSIHDELGSICAGCLNWNTVLSIPAASLVSAPANPFYDGTSVNPYSWTMSAQYPSGFKLTRLVHLDDANVLQNVPGCASVGGAPTAAAPLCWDTLSQTPGKKIVSASGRGLENGKIGFG